MVSITGTGDLQAGMLANQTNGQSATSDGSVSTQPPPQDLQDGLAESQAGETGFQTYNAQGQLLDEQGNPLNQVAGTDGADDLAGTEDADHLTGLAGDDVLQGHGGPDVLAGGPGNDTLDGGEGDDTYLIEAGDGLDRVETWTGVDPSAGRLATDVIRFAEGITAADLDVRRAGWDLWLQVRGTSQQVVLGDFFQDAVGDGRLRPEQLTGVDWVEFADGSTLSAADLIRMGQQGTAGDDWLAGSDDAEDLAGQAGADWIVAGGGADTLAGGSGDDGIEGDAGDDLLDGGTGTDWLTGGEGSDTYRFGRGDGAETIANASWDGPHADEAATTDRLRFKQGVALGDLQALREGDDLILAIRGTPDRVRLLMHFTGSPEGQSVPNAAYRVDVIELDDGTPVDDAFIEQLLQQAVDQPFLHEGDADGNYYQGLVGDNLYRWGPGDGNDWIYNPTAFGANAALRFRPGVSLADLSFSREYDDLLVRVAGTGETLGIGQYFLPEYRLARVELDDGTEITHSAIVEALVASTSGDDNLIGGEGDDTLDGGAGNDTLRGGRGHDTYLFGRGDGVDVVANSAAGGMADSNDWTYLSRQNREDDADATVDTLRFRTGITAADLRIERRDAHLVIGIVGTADEVIVEGYFAANRTDGGYGVDRIELADGTEITADEIRLAVVPQGTAGHDDLLGLDGDETLDGGAGDDYLRGGEGSDTYRFGRGDGRDTIVNNRFTRDGAGDYWQWDYLEPDADTAIDVLRFKAGVTRDDLALQREGDDLVIGIHGTTDAVTVCGFFAQGDIHHGYGLDRIEFDDGSVLTDAEIRATPPLLGTPGDDALDGGDGDDTLDGGAGNDTLRGGGGADTYRFGPGDGVDRVLEGPVSGVPDPTDYAYVAALAGSEPPASPEADVLRLKPGTTEQDLLIRRDGAHLVLQVAGTDDAVIVEGYFALNRVNLGSVIDRIEFADGTQLSEAVIRAAVAPVGSEAAEDLHGLEGDDTLDGGAGDDFLQGGEGNDTYLFGRGDGRDVIANSRARYTYGADDWAYSQPEWLEPDADSTTDVLRFRPGIAREDLTLRRDGADLTLTLRESGDTDSVTLKGFFAQGDFGSAHSVDRIEFADGSILTAADIRAMPIVGTAGDDVLDAWPGNATLQGLQGSDDLRGGTGDDRLDGGEGDDTLTGGRGSDVYEVAPGGGHDRIRNSAGYAPLDPTDWAYVEGWGAEDDAATTTDVLRFQAGISVDDLRIQRHGAHLVLSLQGTDQSVTIEGFFGGAGINHDFGVDRIEFADGSTLDDETLLARVEVYATDGDDVLYGLDTDDTLDGGAGHDTLYGRGGSDTYLFGRGSGADTVVNHRAGWAPNAWDYWWDDFFEADHASATDVLRFKEGLTLADLELQRNGFHLTIGIRGTADQVTILGLYARNEVHHGFGVDRIEFADGTVITDEQLLALPLVGTDAGEQLEALPGTTRLEGRAGNDTLAGFTGDQTLDGGEGADLLQGGPGSDTYLFGRGDGEDRVRSNRAYGVIDPGDYTNVSEGYAEDDAATATDVLRFKAGVVAADLQIARQGAHLVLQIAGTEDRVIVEGFLARNQLNHRHSVDRIEFDDGSVLTDADIRLAIGEPAGTPGDDVLHGLEGDETLDGGAGNDTLQGGEGSDTYLFGRGDGQDVIRNALANGAEPGDWIYQSTQPDFLDADHATSDDVLRFKAGVSREDIAIAREGAHLVLSIIGSDNRVTVEGFFARYDIDHAFGVDRILFADGTALTDADIRAALLDPIVGSDGNDVLYGDLLRPVQGGAGQDTLYGHQGPDTLDGGAGSDLLQGGEGGDLYVFGRGSGHDVVRNHRYPGTWNPAAAGPWLAEADEARTTDVVRLAQGLTLEDLVFRRSVSNLVIGIVGSPGDSLTIDGFFAGNAVNHQIGVDRIELADGTVIDDAYLLFMLDQGGAGDDLMVAGSGNDVLRGNGGADTLRGGAGHDTLDGGSGPDLMEGGTGNDVYLFGRRDGVDVIQNNLAGDALDPMGAPYINDMQMLSDALLTRDVLRFKPGIVPADVLVSRDGAHMRLQIRGTDAVVEIRGFFARNRLLRDYGVDVIEFDDGTVLSDAAIQKALGTGTALSDELDGLSLADVLAGGLGDDTLRGGIGDDTLEGGAGDDLMQGGPGSDVYLFGRGDGRDLLRNSAGDGSQAEADEAVTTDTLRFRRGVRPEDIMARRDGDHLILQIRDTDDEIALESYFQGSPAGYNVPNPRRSIDRIEFTEGGTWAGADIEARLGQPGQSLPAATTGVQLQTASFSGGLARIFHQKRSAASCRSAFS